VLWICNLIEIANLTKYNIDKKYFQKAGESILNKLGQPDDAEISLVFVGDKRMRELNRKYRGIDKTTDVLSFLYSKKGLKEISGEIVISVPRAIRQARLHRYARRHDCRPPATIAFRAGQDVGLAKHCGQAKIQSYPLKLELLALFVHGILHLAGYDDEKQEDYEEMMEKQEEILEQLTIKK